MERQAFGFTRSSCDCAECKKNCVYIPGFLAVEDLRMLTEHLGYTDEKSFARDHLLASPGAVVGNDDGKKWRVSTLVPRRGQNGACHWYTEDEKCAVHAVSPYGCAFFSHALSAEEGHERSKVATLELNRMWQSGKSTTYKDCWLALWMTGRRAPSPEWLRQRMALEHG